MSGENLHVEYKETLREVREREPWDVTKSFQKAVIGMANNEGGPFLLESVKMKWDKESVGLMQSIER